MIVKNRGLFGVVTRSRNGLEQQTRKQGRQILLKRGKNTVHFRMSKKLSVGGSSKEIVRSGG